MPQKRRKKLYEIQKRGFFAARTSEQKGQQKKYPLVRDWHTCARDYHGPRFPVDSYSHKQKKRFSMATATLSCNEEAEGNERKTNKKAQDEIELASILQR